MIIAAEDILTYLSLGSPPSAAWSKLAEQVVPWADQAVKNFCGVTLEQQSYTHFLPHQDFLYTQNGDFVDVVNNRVALYGFSDTRDLLLPETPVRSITNCWADLSALAGQGPTDFGPSTLLVAGTDYYLDIDAVGVSMSGILKRWINVWPARQRSVKVEYVAGYTPDEFSGTTAIGFRPSPTAIVGATVMTAVQHIKTALAFTDGQGFGGAGGIVSERLGDAAFTYSDVAARLLSMQVEVPPQAQRMLQPWVRMMRR